jgi:hypothetical protein
MAYWTVSEEPKAVYHLFQDCEEGNKIEAKNRRDGDPPPGRYLCEVCAAKR